MNLHTYHDLSKAFNRVDHSLIIQDLFDMHTPSWLLKIIASYLSGRTMIVHFNGAESSTKELPGGSPQGAFLGGLIFMIKGNGAFLRPTIPRLHPLRSTKSLNVEYVDDGAVAAEVDLKKHLVLDKEYRPFPLSFRQRTGHMLPPEHNLLQLYLNNIEEFTITRWSLI